MYLQQKCPAIFFSRNNAYYLSGHVRLLYDDDDAGDDDNNIIIIIIGTTMFMVLSS